MKKIFPTYAVLQPPKVIKKFDALADSLINVILISCPIHQLCMLLTARRKQRKYFSENIFSMKFPRSETNLRSCRINYDVYLPLTKVFVMFSSEQIAARVSAGSQTTLSAGNSFKVCSQLSRRLYFRLLSSHKLSLTNWHSPPPREVSKVIRMMLGMLGKLRIEWQKSHLDTQPPFEKINKSGKYFVQNGGNEKIYQLIKMYLKALRKLKTKF